MHLAQVNIGRILAPMDSPIMAEFKDNLDPINALAEATPGFVWRLQSESGNATDVPYSEDPMELVNMSVWESIGSLHGYVYKTHHLDFFRKRAQWFEKPTQSGYALWWIPAGHTPTVAEGKERIEHYRKHGATAHAFWFSQPFPAPMS
jgi:Domain of unknown function (DUF3291)